MTYSLHYMVVNFLSLGHNRIGLKFIFAIVPGLNFLLGKLHNVKLQKFCIMTRCQARTMTLLFFKGNAHDSIRYTGWLRPCKQQIHHLEMLFYELL